jgi:hypothetical protein
VFSVACARHGRDDPLRLLAQQSRSTAIAAITFFVLQFGVPGETADVAFVRLAAAGEIGTHLRYRRTLDELGDVPRVVSRSD